MPKNRKKVVDSRPVKEPTEGLDWRVRSALQGAGFAVKGATKWLGDQTSAIFGRPQEEKSSDLAHVRGSQLASRDATDNLPDLAAEQPFPAVEFFALVNLFDPSQVHFYGVDMGTSAFTVGCAPDGSKTTFGHWNSMESAFKRLDQFAGPGVHLSLVIYDSVPVMAMSALGVHMPRGLDESQVLAIEEGP